tara:strand:+ start:132 stop:251 length:120 start_codon:yes stop_codon:yes gene_type:complete
LQKKKGWTQREARREKEEERDVRKRKDVLVGTLWMTTEM